MKEVRFNKEFFDEKLKEDCFFIKEELLTRLPLDWFDFCTGCHSAMHSNLEAHVIILDDEATAKVMRIYEKEQVDIFVLDSEELRIWQVLAMKDKESKASFVGGENLRKFCDTKKIFYESTLVNDNLISFTNLKYLKKPGEDCRIPITEEEKQKRIDKHKGK